ncbi:MAG: threonylcarbamoyl-AMP synthase [Solobacterium sp.]|nr:threonylcarbamoyl-AMP synthase [Solobacterium sp.]
MKKFDADQIPEMAEILRNNGVLSVPTDTVYGLCARFDTIEAQEHLRDIKKRPKDKAFPIMCCDAGQIRQIAFTDGVSEKIICAFMPGPVTLILKKRPEIPGHVNGDMDTVAVRMASSKALEELIRELGCPVFMTSANLSGEKTCETLDEIEAACPGLDGMMKGNTQFNEASTIIDLSADEIRIVRSGPVKMEDLEHVLQN